MLNCQKEKFSLSPDHHYLNCAYMSPLLKSVEEAGVEGIKTKSNPYQVLPADFFDPPQDLKNSFSTMMNIKDPERVTIIPAVSYLISTVANNIKMNRGDQIMLIDQQFPSQVYPWLRKAKETGADIITVTPPETLEGRGKKWNEKILNTINKKTRVVSMANLHWADGTLFDLMAIRNRCTDVGALLIIDGTQSVGALPMDIDELKPDALACAGYKFLLGPYSIGLAYLGENFDKGIPIEENWINRYESEKFEKLVQYQEEYKPGANRYGVGEHSNFILVPMLKAALDQIQEWKVTSIHDYCGKIIEAPLTALKEADFWIEESQYRGNNLFGIRLPSHIQLERVQKNLRDNQVYVSIRGNSIRVAPHVYNDEEEMWKLVNCLKD